jgi:hypothetical protein
MLVSGIWYEDVAELRDTSIQATIYFKSSLTKTISMRRSLAASTP